MNDSTSKGSEIMDAQVTEVLEGEERVAKVNEKAKGRGRKPKKDDEIAITIPPLKLADVTIEIRGQTEICTNKFSEKAIKMILDKQMQTLNAEGRKKKVPTDDFLGSLYVISGKPKLVKRGDRTYATGATFGIPANALKLAAVSACRQDMGLPMTKALGAFHVMGYMLPILNLKGKPAEPYMRQDVVRLAPPARVADIRFRGSFEEWMIKVPIRYNTRVITVDQIANLLNTAGFAVGLGEWRSEKKGNFGMFSVI